MALGGEPARASSRETVSSRRATVINVFRDGTHSASDAPLLKGVPAVPKGEPMGGRFFPLLLGAAS